MKKQPLHKWILSLWPTHWAGGSRSAEINRITLHSDESAEAQLAFVEHHGMGSGNYKYPLQQDYDFAARLVQAWNLLRGVKKLDQVEIVPKGTMSLFYMCRAWHLGDSWRDSEESYRREAWERHKAALDAITRQHKQNRGQ